MPVDTASNQPDEVIAMKVWNSGGTAANHEPARCESSCPEPDQTVERGKFAPVTEHAADPQHDGGQTIRRLSNHPFAKRFGSSIRYETGRRGALTESLSMRRRKHRHHTAGKDHALRSSLRSRPHHVGSSIDVRSLILREPLRAEVIEGREMQNEINTPQLTFRFLKSFRHRLLIGNIDPVPGDVWRCFDQRLGRLPPIDRDNAVAVSKINGDSGSKKPRGSCHDDDLTVHPEDTLGSGFPLKEHGAGWSFSKRESADCLDHIGENQTVERIEHVPVQRPGQTARLKGRCLDQSCTASF